MEDRDTLQRINELVEEEHELQRRHGAGVGLRADERERLEQLQIELDRCWDLLRQRRARREFGEDPDGAAVRPGGTVEGYLQ